MSAQEGETTHKCVSCGVTIAAMSAARFPCPQCGNHVSRCKRCRKQSTRYNCPDCGFEGP